MRSDYALYVVSALFFLLTAIAAVLLNIYPEREVWVVTTAVLGFLFIGIGYSQRPRLTCGTEEALPKPAREPAPSTPAPSMTTTVVVEQQQKTETVAEITPLKTELTKVKGVGPKRLEQLSKLGITSAEELASASPEDLATKLKISPKITTKCVEDAKKLVKKS
ncbi:MAG TPA: helix-hairpin-helix domain-containing protein [Candidatus Bathyarchaeia archaeon]